MPYQERSRRAEEGCRIGVAYFPMRLVRRWAQEPKEPNMGYTRLVAPCPLIAEDLLAEDIIQLAINVKVIRDCIPVHRKRVEPRSAFPSGLPWPRGRVDTFAV